MTWMLNIRRIDSGIRLRMEGITPQTEIPRKDEAVYIGESIFLVSQVVWNYDAKVITVHVKEVLPEWFHHPLAQSAQNETPSALATLKPR